MGYTHYATTHRDFTDAEWGEVTERARWIVAAAAAVGIDLAGPDGDGEPVIDGERIAFNGRGEPGGPLVYEAAVVTRERDGDGWGFTKTGFENRPTRPYDAAVVAIFEGAATTAREALTWSSDGDEADHAAGLRLLELADRMRDLNDRARELRAA